MSFRVMWILATGPAWTGGSVASTAWCCFASASAFSGTVPAKLASGSACPACVMSSCSAGAAVVVAASSPRRALSRASRARDDCANDATSVTTTRAKPL